MGRLNQLSLTISSFVATVLTNHLEKTGEPLASFLERAALAQVKSELPLADFLALLDESLFLKQKRDKNLGLAFRIGDSITNKGMTLNANQTLDIFKNDCSNNNFTIFSTSVLSDGFSGEKQTEIRDNLKNGKSIFAFFIPTLSSGGKNEVAIAAKVEDFESFPSQQTTQKFVGLEVPEFANTENTIFLKLSNFVSTPLKASDLEVITTGRRLSSSFTGRASFFYVQF